MSKIFICSDLHFNHDREFIWGSRGFHSVEEMNEAIIERHNSKVNPEDDGFIHNYHRGDGFVKLLDSAVPKMMQVLTKAEM